MRPTLILLLAATALAGCTWPKGPGASQTQPALAPGNPLAKPPAEALNNKDLMLVVRMEIASIEVPVGTASATEDLWAYLDEEAVRTFGQADLGLNGLRVGVGKANTWADVARILRRMTGRTFGQASTYAIPGDPMHSVLKRNEGPHTIFVFYERRLLTGADYPAGEYVLSTSCTIDDDDPSSLLLTALPQIRSAKESLAVVREGEGIALRPKPFLYSFNALTFQARLKSQDFVVIGPTLAAQRADSAGHSFLFKQREGVDFETVLVLRPTVEAVRRAPTGVQ